MNWPDRAILLLLALTLMAACESAPAPPRATPTPDIALWIDGEPVLMHDFKIDLRIFIDESGETGAISPERFREICTLCARDIAQRKVLRREAQKRGISLKNSPADVSGLFPEPTRLPEGFRALESDARTWKNRVRERLELMRIAAAITEDLGKDITITDEDIQAAYQAEIQRFAQPMEIETRCIRVFKRDLAESIHKKLRRGWSFTRLAEKYSTLTGPGAKGDIFREKITEFPESFAEALKTTRLRRITPLLESDDGFFIFKIYRRFPEYTLPLEEVKDTLREELRKRERARRFRNWLNDALANVDIRWGHLPDVREFQQDEDVY